MNLKNNKKAVGFICIALILVSCLIIRFGGINTTVSGVSVEYTERTILDSYSLNDRIEIPDANIVLDEQKYKATTKSLRYPSGNEYSGNIYSLNELGEYTVRYSAMTSSGKPLQYETRFSVLNKLFSVNGENSTAYYGYDDLGKQNAVIVSLSMGDTFTFNKPINLNDNKEENNILRFYTLNKSIGLKEVKYIRVRLTDVLDESNYVDIVTVANAWYDEMNGEFANYSGAGAYNQDLVGLHYKDKPSSTTIKIDGKDYTPFRGINVSEDKGYPSTDFSFVAKDGYGERAYELSMDYEKRQIFGNKAVNPLSSKMITDLDDTMLYQEIWSGFKTGYAKLSIFADAYVGSTFNFAITNIDGEDLSSNKYDDKDAPIISVQLPKDGVIPNAVKGMEYKIFDAYAFDFVDGYVDVEKYVFCCYNSNVNTAMNIKDGAFVPLYACNYDVVYRAKDRNGNIGEKTITVLAKDSHQLDMEISELSKTQFKSGERVTLSRITHVNHESSITCRVVAENADKNVSYNLYENSDGFYEFVPLYSGTYTVKYICEDYIGSSFTEQTITVDASGVSVISEQPDLPLVFVKGINYSLPVINGLDLSSGEPVEVKADVYYMEDDGKETAYSGENVKVGAEKTFTVIYKVGTTENEYSVPVVNVNYDGDLLKQNYFYANEFTAESDTEKVVYKTTAKNEATLKFIKPLSVEGFSLSFSVNTKNFDKLLISLTDVENPDNTLTIQYYDTAELYRVYKINDGAEQVFKKDFFGKVALNYSNFNSYISSNEDVIRIKNFNGFNSSYAYLTITLVGLTEESAISVYELNGNIFNNKKDNTKPQLFYKIDDGYKKLNETLSISKIVCDDVFSFSTDVKYSVFNPNGSVCIATDSTTLKDIEDLTKRFVVNLEELGTYYIEISYYDYFGNGKEISIPIYVKDSVAPTITLHNKVEASSVGTVKIADFTVIDNLDDDIAVKVFITEPSQKTYYITGNSFTANGKGIYTVSYYAVDSEKNLGFISYEVVVK